MRTRTLLLTGVSLTLVLVVLAAFFSRSSASQRFDYAVTVTTPMDVVPHRVSYACFFNADQADIVLADADATTFQPAVGASFIASVRGFRDSRFFGLITSDGRERYLVVRVEDEDGHVRLGHAEIPDEVSPITIDLPEATP